MAVDTVWAILGLLGIPSIAVNVDMVHHQLSRTIPNLGRNFGLLRPQGK
jgi:hypothetical protein